MARSGWVKAGWIVFEKFLLALVLGVFAAIGTCELDRMKAEDAEREDRTKAHEAEKADRLKAADSTMLEITKRRVDATDASLIALGKELKELDDRSHEMADRFGAAQAACRAQLHIAKADPPELHQCVAKAYKPPHYVFGQVDTEDRPLVVDDPTNLWIEPQLRHELHQYRRKVVDYRWGLRMYEYCLFHTTDFSGVMGCEMLVSSSRGDTFNAYGDLQRAFDAYVRRTLAQSRGEDAGTNMPDGGYEDYMKASNSVVHVVLTTNDAGQRVAIHDDGGVEILAVSADGGP